MNDRTLPIILRIALIWMAVMQLIFGLTLLVNPAAITDLWPWPLSLTSARLLGASTLVSVPLAILSAVANRWSVARIPLVMMLTYRVLQIAAGLVHIQRFDFSQPTTWNYFGGGGLMMLIMLFALMRGNQLGQHVTDSPRWLRGAAALELGGLARGMLLIAGVVYFLVGVLFFILGERATWLWFESAGQLTGLTARLFASPTTGLALAMWLITRAKYWREVGVPAIGMTTFGLAGSLAMLLGLSDIAPSSILGYLIPITPLVLLIIGLYLLIPGRARKVD